MAPTLLVLGLIYQLLQPPLCHTVWGNCFTKKSSNRFWVEARSSKARAGGSRRRIQLMIYRACASIISIWDVCPTPVLGPRSMKKFGKPCEVIPRKEGVVEARVALWRPTIGKHGLQMSKPVAYTITSTSTCRRGCDNVGWETTILLGRTWTREPCRSSTWASVRHG